METGYTIDTADAFVELEEAGLDQQAAMAIVGLVSRSDSRLATKAGVKSSIESLRVLIETSQAATNARSDSLQEYMETRFEAVERRLRDNCNAAGQSLKSAVLAMRNFSCLTYG